MLEKKEKRSNNKKEGVKDRSKDNKGGRWNNWNDRPRNGKSTINSRQGGGGKSEKGEDTKNPCGISGHENHDWKDYIYNSNGSSFKGEARSPKDYNKETGKLKGTGKKKREENHRTEQASNEDSSESKSDDKLNYNSDSTEKFNHIEGQVKSKKSTLSTEILIAVPDRVGSKSYKLLLGFAETGTAASLANEKVLQ